MAYQEIGLGTTAADGTGDTIRAGGDKINDNFVEIYTLLGTGTALSSGISATATVVTLTAPTISGVVGGTQTSATITTLATTTVNATTLNGTIGTAAQTNITSLGTLTALVVDDVSINGKVIVMTGDTNDTVTFTTAANGTLSIVTVDTAGAAGNIQVTADGTVDIDSAGVLTLDSGAAINIEPAAGSAILLDGTISIDAGVVTGVTSITSDSFNLPITLNATDGSSTDAGDNIVQNTAANENDRIVYEDATRTHYGPEIYKKGGDISSASPLVIDVDGDYFDVTGTTSFAAMTVAADRQFTLQFDGILTMTHHATNLDLPGAANITTAAGDVGVFQSTGANTVQCISYTKADGTAVAVAAVVGGGPSKGTAPSTFYRTNGKVQKEDIVMSNHSATFSATNATNLLDKGTDDDFADDMNVRLTGSDLPNGWVIDTDYFVRDVASGTLKLALTIGGTAVTISDDGSGTNTIFEVINAGVTGPITIKTGNSLTVPSGSRVVIQ